MDAPVLIALVPIAFFGVWGFKEGVVKRVVEIAGVLVTLILTARFAAAVQPKLSEMTGLEGTTAVVLTWAVLFFAGMLLSRVLAAMVSKAVRLTILRWLDRWGGAIMGLALGLLVVSVLLISASQIPGGEKIQQAYDRTELGKVIFYAAPSVYTQVRKLGGSRVEEIWNSVLDTARSKTSAGMEGPGDDRPGDRFG